MPQPAPKKAPIDHLHRENKTLKFTDDMDLKVAQFYDMVTIDTSLPLPHA